MAVTLFAKSGDDYIRVATNVSTRVAGGRGLGTILSGPGKQSHRNKKNYAVGYRPPPAVERERGGVVLVPFFLHPAPTTLKPYRCHSRF